MGSFDCCEKEELLFERGNSTLQRWRFWCRKHSPRPIPRRSFLSKRSSLCIIKNSTWSFRGSRHFLEAFKFVFLLSSFFSSPLFAVNAHRSEAKTRELSELSRRQHFSPSPILRSDFTKTTIDSESQISALVAQVTSRLRKDESVSPSRDSKLDWESFLFSFSGRVFLVCTS